MSVKVMYKNVAIYTKCIGGYFSFLLSLTIRR